MVRLLSTARSSTNPEPYVADRFGAEALFKFSQDFGLGDLFEFIVQRWLQDPDEEHAFAQRDRS